MVCCPCISNKTFNSFGCLDVIQWCNLATLDWCRHLLTRTLDVSWNFCGLDICHDIELTFISGMLFGNGFVCLFQCVCVVSFLDDALTVLINCTLRHSFDFFTDDGCIWSEAHPVHLHWITGVSHFIAMLIYAKNIDRGCAVRVYHHFQFGFWIDPIDMTHVIVI